LTLHPLDSPVNDAVVDDGVDDSVRGHTDEQGQQPGESTEVESDRQTTNDNDCEREREHIVRLGCFAREMGGCISMVAPVETLEYTVHDVAVYQVGDGLHSEEAEYEEEE